MITYPLCSCTCTVELIYRHLRMSDLPHQSRELEVKGHFSQFHYWNLQMSPTADDKLLQALVWAQLAPSVSLSPCIFPPPPIHVLFFPLLNSLWLYVMSVGIAGTLCNFSLMPRRGEERTSGLHCLHLCLIIAECHVAELGVCTYVTIDHTGASLH